MIASPPPPPTSGPGPAPAPSPSPPPVAEFPSSNPPTFYATSQASDFVDADLERFADGTARVIGVTGVRSSRTDEFVSGNFEYRGPDDYAVEFFGMGGPSFSSADKISSTAEFERYRYAFPDGHFANLELARPVPGLVLTYSSFGNVSESVTTPDDVVITFFAVGSRTPTSQMPRTGSASFSGIADGLWIDGGVTRRLYGSPAMLSANFSTGQIGSVLELRGYDNPFGDFASTPTTTLGTFTGTGMISSGPFFTGSFAQAAGYSGSFHGQFFGPSANEAGWSFRLTGDATQTVFGAAIVRRP